MTPLSASTRTARPPGSPVPLITIDEAPLVSPRLDRDHAFHRVRTGVYAAADAWQRLKPWQRYAARVHAYALRHPDAVFLLESAAVVHGLPVFGEPRAIHVLAPVHGKSRRFGDVAVHASARPREIVQVGHLSGTSAVDTAMDLMRVLPPAFALAVGDAVVSSTRRRAASLPELSAAAAGLRGARGSRRLGILLPLVDARAESPGESVSRAVILWCGFAAPELQVEFTTDGVADRVDFWWQEVRSIGESDGLDKYRAETAEEAAERIAAEKRRELRLRRQSNHFGRWDWAAALRVVPLEEQLTTMRVPRVGPRRSALLATLASHPRSLPPARPATAGTRR